MKIVARYGDLTYFSDENHGVSYGQLRDWKERQVKSLRFPSLYAMKNAEEHFCEAIAYKAMGSLADDISAKLEELFG